MLNEPLFGREFLPANCAFKLVPVNEVIMSAEGFLCAEWFLTNVALKETVLVVMFCKFVTVDGRKLIEFLHSQ